MIRMNTKRNCVIAMLICVVIMLLACQPTPEIAPVVNKSEDIPKGAIKEEAESTGGEDDKCTAYDMSEYEAVEHWQEEIEKNDRFVVTADVDVMMPIVDKYPVEKLETKQLPQEMADRLISCLVPEGTQFYQYPAPTPKSYYEDELIFRKQELAKMEAEGDEWNVTDMREYISELEQKLLEAPEQPEIEYANTQYTYPHDWETGEPLTADGDGYINIAAATLDCSMGAEIYVYRGDEYGSNFHFNNCTYITETDVANTADWVKEDEKRLANIADPQERAQEEEYIADNREYAQHGEQAMLSNGMDMDAAKQQLVELLEECGIGDVQITKTEKALTSPPIDYNSTWVVDTDLPDQNAVYLEFTRECGGIPGVMQSGGTLLEKSDWSGNMYCPPFELEQGRAVVDESGAIVHFSWSYAAEKIETVAADAELLPFDEIKRRATDHIYYMNSYFYDDEYNMETNGIWIRFEIDKAILKMSYVNAKDDPGRVLMVPVWYIGAQEYYDYEENEGDERKGNYEEVLINALDGGAVLLPGSDMSPEEYAAVA